MKLGKLIHFSAAVLKNSLGITAMTSAGTDTIYSVYLMIFARLVLPVHHKTSVVGAH